MLCWFLHAHMFSMHVLAVFVVTRSLCVHYDCWRLVVARVFFVVFVVARVFVLHMLCFSFRVLCLLSHVLGLCLHVQLMPVQFAFMTVAWKPATIAY